jgi:hypothetical protein
MAPFDAQRVIAFDVRPKSIGFVVFEGEGRLLDWGVKSFPGGARAARIPPGSKIRALIAVYVPDALVLKQPSQASCKMLTELREVAKAAGITIYFLGPRAVRNVFTGCRNKDQVAAVISERFAELLWSLPPRRKIWKSEDYRMNIFDAAATGIAYFSRKRPETNMPVSPS